MDLRELLSIASTYRWGIVGIAAVCCLATVLWVNTVAPIYLATTTLLIHPNPDQAVPTQEVYDPGYESAEYYYTQQELLHSRDMRTRVVQRLQLIDDPEFGIPAEAPERNGITRWLADSAVLAELPLVRDYLESTQPRARTPVERMNFTLKRLANALTVEPVQRTRLMYVHIRSESPQTAASIANELAQVYIESGLEARLESTRTATNWLTDKLTDIRADLETSEKRLQEYRESKELVSVGGTRSLFDEELLESTRRLHEAQKRKVELSSAYWKIRQAGEAPENLARISVLLLDPLVQRANEQLLQARQRFKQIEERYGSLHPELAAAQGQLVSAEKAFHDQLRVSAQSLAAQFEIAQQNERQYQERVERARAKIRELDRKEYELRVLERDVSTNRQLHDLFLTRFKESDSSATYQSLNAQVVDAAVPPSSPIEPNKRKALILALIGGLLLGLAVAALRRALGDRVRSVDEAESAVGAPVISVLPLVRKRLLRSNLAKHFEADHRTPFAEGIRSIRASMHLAHQDQPCRRVAVTSTVAEEGKSSIAASLAMACATMESTLLLEADLRVPSLRRLLSIPAEQPGLVDLLAGHATLEDCLYRLPSGVFVISAAAPAPNPAEIVAGTAMRSFMLRMSERFERIIVDTPPVLAAADASIIAGLVDATVFVVRADGTTRRSVRAAAEQLHRHNRRLLGTALNQVDVNKHRSAYAGYHYAYDYYG